MNLLLLKQLSILSAFAGVILGLITIVPYVSFLSFMILTIVFTYPTQNKILYGDLYNIKQRNDV